MQTHASLFFSSEYDISRYSRFIAASLALHITLLLIIVFAPSIRSRGHFRPSVINVDLVSSFPSAPAPRSQKTASSNIIKKKTVAKKIPIKTEKKKPGSAEIKIKKSLKKKTFKSSNVIKEAIEQIKSSVDTQRQEAIKKAMERLSDQVKSDSAISGNQSFGASGTFGSGGRSSDILAVYKAEILFRIQKNWSFSEHLAGGRTDLAVKLAIKIMPDGEIRDIWFDERSGNRYLDESARKAVLKSNPLPPLPKGFNGPFLKQGLRFTPSGVR